MAQKVTNYKCPSCSGPLHFDAASGRLKCDYCESEYDPDHIEEIIAETQSCGDDTAAADISETGPANAEVSSKIVGKWDSGQLSDDWQEDGARVKVYSCPSCGAELILDETTAATSCPYCGNNTVIPGQLEGTCKPDYIIPFSCTKDEAKAKLKDYYRGKYFLPGSFRDSNHIDEIKGLYVPFWFFEGTAHASLTGEGLISRESILGNDIVRTTEHYHISREGDVKFDKIPVDASSRMPDDYMDSLEPFDYSSLKEFSPAYLAGFMADKYDVEFQDVEDRVNSRCASTATSQLMSTVSGYTSVRITSSTVDVTKGKVSYGLLPVWLLNSNFEGTNYKFAVNGQTGKVVGRLPVSKKRACGVFAGVTAVFELLFVLLMLWMNGAYGHSLPERVLGYSKLGIVYSVLLSVIVTVLLYKSMKNVRSATAAGLYVPAGGLNISPKSDYYTHTTRVVQRGAAAVRSGRVSGGISGRGSGFSRPGAGMRPGGFRSGGISRPGSGGGFSRGPRGPRR